MVEDGPSQPQTAAADENPDVHSKEEEEEEDRRRSPLIHQQRRRGGGGGGGGVLSRLWNGVFRTRDDDFEKRLRHISKEESSLLLGMKKRARTWRRFANQLIIISTILEVIAVVYAIMTTRSLDLNWKIRASRVLPMFLLPALSTIMYSTVARFTKMFDDKDQKSLERLRSERRAKIDELKERTNFYTTQQLIQRYDPDPAAKAAAASVLASKLGADSGLQVYLGDDLKLGTPSGRSNSLDLMPSTGLRNRKQSQIRSTGAETTMMRQFIEETSQGLEMDAAEATLEDQVVLAEQHLRPSGQDGGWIARIAALLVGEDPTQCYALICGNCHMHNGLARKEDFPYITYYCPHCHSLNGSHQQEEHASISTSTNTETNTNLSCPATPVNFDVINNSLCESTVESKVASEKTTAVGRADERDGGEVYEGQEMEDKDDN